MNVYDIYRVRSATKYYLISDALTLARASIWCRTMGLLPNSTRGLGLERVSGLNLVPKPPTKISAFIVEKLREEIQKRSPQLKVKG